MWRVIPLKFHKQWYHLFGCLLYICTGVFVSVLHTS
jgi:hypothetical protein